MTILTRRSYKLFSYKKKVYVTHDFTVQSFDSVVCGGCSWGEFFQDYSGRIEK